VYIDEIVSHWASPLQVRHVARRLSLSPRMVRHLAKTGALRAHKLGRKIWGFDIRDVEELRRRREADRRA
jgi:hypothetical protein